MVCLHSRVAKDFCIRVVGDLLEKLAAALVFSIKTVRQLLILLLIAAIPTVAAQRTVEVAPAAIFPFDPLSGRYVKHSLAPVATYIAAWREAGSEVRVSVSDSALAKAYRLYLDIEDSTLMVRVLEYLNAQKSDTIIQPAIDALYEFPQSREFLSHFDPDIERIKRFFATPLAIRDSAVVFDPYAPSDFSRLFHAFQLTASGADLSLFAPATLDAQIPQQLFIKTIFSLFPFDNQMTVIKLRGREVKVMLEKIYSTRYFTLRNDRSDLLRHRLPAYLHSSLAGASYEVDLTKSEGERIENLSLEPDTIYSIATNSFAARDIEQQVHLGDYKTLLIKYLQIPHIVKSDEQWRLKPERWAREIKLREMGTIFGK